MRPLLRRFGLTGLTFPEIGLAGADRDLQARGYAGGVRFFRMPAGATLPAIPTSEPSLPESFLAVPVPPDPDAVFDAMRDRPDGPDLLLVEMNGAEPASLARFVKLKQRHRLRGVGAVVDTAEELRLALDVTGLDAIELEFSALRQETLLDCLAELRRWGGAVMVRGPLAAGLLDGHHQPDGHQSADDHHQAEAARDLGRLWSERGRPVGPTAMQVALLPDVVSLALVDDAQCGALFEMSFALPPLSLADLRQADAVLRSHGLTSALADTYGRRILVGPSGPPPPSQSEASEASDARVLAQPLRLGSMTLPNRIVRSGTTERAVDAAGLPTADMMRIHRELAAGGAGLVITGYLAVDQTVRASQSHGVLAPGPAVAAWSTIVAACRDAGPARLCAQLGHGGRPAPGEYDEREIVRQFRCAATAAAEAGFDAVQLHAAHGYLLGQLVAAGAPLRERPSEHPGLELVLRVLNEVCLAVQPELAVLVKANVSDFVPGGYGVEDADAFADALARTPVSAVEWSGWTPQAQAWYTPSRLGEAEVGSEGYFVPFAGRVKLRHPGLVVGSCGGFRSAAGMARAITNGGTDFVALSRSLIAEPDLPAKILAGARRGACDGCNECLGKAIRPVHCPRSGGQHAAVAMGDQSTTEGEASDEKGDTRTAVER